jgi:hypothetical protein
MMRALQGEPLDDAFARHLVDDICLPLLIATTDPSAIDPSAGLVFGLVDVVNGTPWRGAG